MCLNFGYNFHNYRNLLQNRLNNLDYKLCNFLKNSRCKNLKDIVLDICFEEGINQGNSFSSQNQMSLNKFCRKNGKKHTLK